MNKGKEIAYVERWLKVQKLIANKKFQRNFDDKRRNYAPWFCFNMFWNP